MKSTWFLLVAAVVISFFCGRYIGRFDGPHIVHYYVEPPIDWRAGAWMGATAISIDCDTVHMNKKGWYIHDVDIDIGAHEISGRGCGKASQ